MRNKSLKLALVFSLMGLITGCGSNASKDETTSEESAVVTEAVETNTDIETETDSKCPLEDGTYVADFNTDSSMFHVNEANNGKGTLIVKDGVMTIHISLPSKSIVNLYPGLVEDAIKDGAVLLEPTIDSVTYSDNTTEEVHGFDIPVPVLDEEFDLALIGTKGKWYDHKVSVSNPIPVDDIDIDNSSSQVEAYTASLEDGEYEVDITMEGGTGKATIESPAKVTVKDGVSYVTITWSSPNYDYMIMDGNKYLPVNTEGNSVFELPISEFGTPITVIGDTTAMSKPHEVEYTITCNLR